MTFLEQGQAQTFGTKGRKPNACPARRQPVIDATVLGGLKDDVEDTGQDAIHDNGNARLRQLSWPAWIGFRAMQEWRSARSDPAASADGKKRRPTFQPGVELNSASSLRPRLGFRKASVVTVQEVSQNHRKFFQPKRFLENKRGAVVKKVYFHVIVGGPAHETAQDVGVHFLHAPEGGVPVQARHLNVHHNQVNVFLVFAIQLKCLLTIGSKKHLELVSFQADTKKCAQMRVVFSH
jgi:hypothetical protein